MITQKRPLPSLVLLTIVLFFHQYASWAQTGSPSVVTLTPANNSTGVAPADHVYITFDRSIFKGTGDILLRKTSNNSIVWTTPMWSIVDVKITGATAEILLPFQGNESYYVEIPGTAFKDASDNFFPGFSTTTGWNFTTFTDVSPPTVVTRTPADMATGVATNTFLTLTFNEDIQTGSGSILVKQSSDDATVVGIDLSSPNAHFQKTANSITISAPLTTNTSYYVIIPASGISDLYGNYFAGFTTSSGWSFTTSGVENSLPAATSLDPADNAIDVSPPANHVYITFDRNVFKGSGNILLRKTPDQSIVYTTPIWSIVDVKITGASIEILLPFAGNESYYVEIPNTAFRDASNNYFPGFLTSTNWNFTTFSDDAPPAVVTRTPVHMATGVATNTLLGLTFNEDIQTVSGNILVKQSSDNATVVDIDLTNSSAHFQKTANSISISAPLKPNTSYYVIIPASGIRDLYGNYFTGFTTSAGWNFTTSGVQNSLPSITSLTPADNAINVTPADHVYITFDRNVFKGSGDIRLRRVSDQSIAYTTPIWSVVDVKITGASVEILLPMVKNERYYVEIPGSAFKDVDNNYFAGIATTDGWNFGMIFDPPVITSFSPSTGGAGSTITITGTHLTYTSSVTFGGSPAASFTLIAPNTIAAVVGAGTSGDVAVTTPGGIATLSGFTFIPPPVISAFTPSSAGQGATISITGTDFTNTTTVSFGGTPATSFTVNSATSISAVVGTGSSGDVSVTTPGGTGTKSGFTFVPAPVISTSTPASAGQGTTVSITGTNFTGATAVAFGGTPAASFTVNSATNISAVVGAGASGNISVTTPGGTATQAGFNFIPAPEISSFSPSSAGPGGTVSIIGTNFTGAAVVTFGGTPVASFTVNSATNISAVVGAGASGNISVTTPGGTATQTGFNFIPAPEISSFSPSSAGQGSTVSISGTNFTGATVVTFGGTSAASFTVNTGTSISAVVGTGASGDISVTTPGGTASHSGFTFSGPITDIEHDFNRSGVDIFPNPSDGNFIFILFDASWERKRASIRLLTMNGSIVTHDQVECKPSVKLRLDDQGTIPDGLYIISISAGSKNTVRKISINR